MRFKNVSVYTLCIAGLMICLVPMLSRATSTSVLIDPDGNPATSIPLINSAAPVDTLDWAVGNALWIPVFGSVVVPTQGFVFQSYAQAALSSMRLNGSPAAFPIGYEWTFIAGVEEQFTFVSSVDGGPGGTAEFKVVPGGSNFFQIYYDATPDANDLAGTGFGPGPGSQLILSGTINAGSGTFTRNRFGTGMPGGVGNPLDQLGSNNYPTVSSVNGGGFTDLFISVNSFDPAFFTTGGTGMTLDFTTELKLAFQQTNPSLSFTLAPGALPTMGSGVPTVGMCNGCGEVPDQVTKNMVFQQDASNTDASNRFISVPEPASLALVALGLTAVGWSGKRRGGPTSYFWLTGTAKQL